LRCRRARPSLAGMGLTGVLLAGSSMLGSSSIGHSRLTLVRHGQSTYNAEGRFTGWADVPLTTAGHEEAKAAGRMLAGIKIDVAFTSELQRAIATADIVLDHSCSQRIPVHRHWRLNERHYGSLTGRLKADVVAEYGADMVTHFRHSYDTPPPLVDDAHPAFPGNDPMYSHVPRHLLPRGEGLHDTFLRCVPYFESAIVPELQHGQNVLVAAHGHVIRALIKHLEQLSDAQIATVSISNGVPLVYELDEHLRPIAPADGHAGKGGGGDGGGGGGDGGGGGSLAEAADEHACLGMWLR